MVQVGAWTLGEELGRGGMGVVYRARDAQGREAALKLLPLGALSREALARFGREAEALRRLEHPALGRLLDAGVEQGRAWLAMELIQGEDLQRLLGRTGPLEPRRVIELGVALARGLDHAHARGVVHRDVKPANVLLRADGSPVLVDFGLARLLGDARLTASGVALGTPGYLAPELADGDGSRMGPGTDVWGLGSTLHALLCGQPPIVGDSAVQALWKVLADDLPSLGVRLATLDPGLVAVVDRCLHRDPGRRWPSAGALASALEGLLAPAPVATPIRRRLPVGWVLALLLGVGAAAVAHWRAAARGEAPRGDAPEVAIGSALGDPPPPAPPGPELDPEASAEWEARAEERVEAGDWAGALPLLDRAVALNPDQATLLSNRATARAEVGDRAGAWEDCERAVALEPDLVTARHLRARLRTADGDAAGALEDLDRVLELAPGRHSARLERAVLHRARRDLQGACIDLDAALALRPDQADVWLERAWVRWDLRDLDGAEADARLALELDPARASAHHALALVSEDRRDVLAALEHYTRAAALDPAEPRYPFGRGWVRLESGDARGAKEDLERALELGGPAWPKADTAREWLARAEQALSGR